MAEHYDMTEGALGNEKTWEAFPLCLSMSSPDAFVLRSLYL